MPESFTNDSKERWATDLKILLQRKDIVLPRDRELVGHSIKRRVLASGKVSFDAELTTRGGYADRFWAIALACQKEPRSRHATGCVNFVPLITSMRSASSFIDDLQSRGRYHFSTAEAAKALGSSLSATQAALRRLKAKGEIADQLARALLRARPRADAISG